MSERTIKRIIILLFLLLYLPMLYNDGYDYLKRTAVDLPSFYLAAQVTFDDGGNPYDLAVLEEAAGEKFHQPIYPYFYPPPSLLVFSPFASMNYQLAKRAMLLLNHLLLLASLYLVLFKVLKLKLGQPMMALGVVYILTFYPLPLTIRHGQVNLIVLVLLCLTWLSLREKRPAWLSALPLALAILLKVYPGLLLVYFLIKRKNREIFWTLGLLAGLSVAAFFVLPGEIWGQWFNGVLLTGGYGSVIGGSLIPAGPWNQSINGFTARLFLANPYADTLLPNEAAARWLPYLLALLVLGATAWATWRSTHRDEDAGQTDLEYALFLLAMYLLAPFSWEHHLVIVLPAILLAVVLLVESRGGWLSLVVIGGAAVLLGWEYRLTAEFMQEGLLTLLISAKGYGVAILWAYLLFRLWSPSQAKAETAA